MRIRFFSIAVVLFVATFQTAAIAKETKFEQLRQLFESGTQPNLSDFTPEQEWQGNYVARENPDVVEEGQFSFYFNIDPVFGSRVYGINGDQKRLHYQMNHGLSPLQASNNRSLYTVRPAWDDVREFWPAIGMELRFVTVNGQRVLFGRRYCAQAAPLPSHVSGGGFVGCEPPNVVTNTTTMIGYFTDREKLKM